MLVFLDESFRKNKNSGRQFGVLAGVAIPEDTFHILQRDIFNVRQPYHGEVLRPDDELHGADLLNTATLKRREIKGYSQHWNLVVDLLNYMYAKNIRVFGVVCYRKELQSFVCDNEIKLDITFKYLFERIDGYMKREFPARRAKLVFDNRDHKTHEKNAKAITNFFVRSQMGLGYDSILRVPFFAVSQGHNYGLQLADIVTTVIGLYFQGKQEYDPLWKTVRKMLYYVDVGGQRQSSLKVMRDEFRLPWEQAQNEL
jgi:hypothetical protein